MVEKIYLTDPYLRELPSRIAEVRGNIIFLERTIFFPEAGGQVGDSGYIGEIRVADTQKIGGRPFARENFPLVMLNGEVGHRVRENGATPRAGDEVMIQIDWPRRYAIMRHHSAAHLAYYCATKARPDLYVKGCRIDETCARFDFYARERIDTAEMGDWEGASNEFVAADLEISNEPLDGNAEALMWHCGSIAMPCGGTHVRSTGELDQIRLRRKRQGANLERLYITLAAATAAHGTENSAFRSDGARGTCTAADSAAGK